MTTQYRLGRYAQVRMNSSEIFGGICTLNAIKQSKILLIIINYYYDLHIERFRSSDEEGDTSTKMT